MGTGSGFNKIKPGPTNPLGATSAPPTDPWMQNPTQTCILIGENPTGLQVADTHCHPYDLKCHHVITVVAQPNHYIWRIILLFKYIFDYL
jgi:hypothetical protein